VINLREYLSGKNLYSIVLHLLVVVLAVEVYILMRQNRELKEGRASTPQETIKEGDYLSLSDLTPVTNGSHLDTVSRKQLIFVFTTRCPSCKETLPMWKSLADTAIQRKSFAVFGICLDPLVDTKTYVSENQLRFPVFIPVNKESFSKNNRVQGVPQTILRDRTGFVEKAQRGRLSVDMYNEILHAISDGIIHH
jgi:cytochrome oxidase Cu insertion factor (SCO1/SenC/PrrC family)